jgi:hypothetical protein
LPDAREEIVLHKKDNSRVEGMSQISIQRLSKVWT